MKRTISISLVFFLLIGQAGFTIASHYCMGRAVSTGLAIGKKLPVCSMEIKQSCETAVSDDGLLVKEEPCCEDYFTIIEANRELLKSLQQIHSNLSFNIVTFIPVIVFPKDSELSVSTAVSHSPPGNEHDIQVLLQTFLI